MTEIPQPSTDPYSIGDRVRIYLDPNDHDAEYHGLVCEVTEVFTDELDSETGRSLDSYSYGVVTLETSREIPVSFRHRDLVQISEKE